MIHPGKTAYTIKRLRELRGYKARDKRYREIRRFVELAVSCVRHLRFDQKLYEELQSEKRICNPMSYEMNRATYGLYSNTKVIHENSMVKNQL